MSLWLLFVIQLSVTAHVFVLCSVDHVINNNDNATIYIPQGHHPREFIWQVSVDKYNDDDSDVLWTGATEKTKELHVCSNTSSRLDVVGDMPR